MANGRNREIDPTNLGIKELLGRPRDIHINVMVGQDTIEDLKEALKPDYYPEYIPLGVHPLHKGRFLLVSGIEEGGTRSELTYGIFTSEGNTLPDPYACARVIGRYQRLRETLDQIVGLLR